MQKDYLQNNLLDLVPNLRKVFDVYLGCTEYVCRDESVGRKLISVNIAQFDSCVRVNLFIERGKRFVQLVKIFFYRVGFVFVEPVSASVRKIYMVPLLSYL